MGYFSTMIYLTCGKLDLRTIVPDRIHPHQTAKGQIISHKKVVSPTAVTAGDTTQGIAYLAD